MRKQPIDHILRPLETFAAREASGGIVLIVATLLALAWANFGPAHSYERFFETSVSFGFGDWSIAKSLHHWINDGLMTVFFLVVGLEIKRELLVGELASFQKAALPVAGALGGMLAPALLYLAFNLGAPTQAGWGIPMATDIAFVIGVLALLGDRIPVALKVFLVALAIVDDIGAVLVIALFYTADLNVTSLIVAGILVGALILSNWLGVRSPFIFGLLGLGLWLAFLNSGVHATIAGVVLAFTVPASTRIMTRDLVLQGRRLLDELERADNLTPYAPISDEEQSVIGALEAACERAETPMQRLERVLHPWSVFVIMPLFALANAGIHIGTQSFALASPLTLGILMGLVVGKPIGITLFTWLAVKTRLATLGEGVQLRHIAGAGCLGGIGFTMSIFITNLAFTGGEHLEAAKAAILLSSIVAGIAGTLVLRSTTRSDCPETQRD